MRELKGNGGEVGRPAQPQSLVSGGGCLRHNCSDCMKCPSPSGECDFDSSRESALKRRNLLGGTLNEVCEGVM